MFDHLPYQIATSGIGPFLALLPESITPALICGASEGEVKDWVGHRDSRIVEHYRQLSSEDSRRKMEQLDLLEDRSGQEGPDCDQSARQGQEERGGVNKTSS